MIATLETLAQVNAFGAPFLFAYGFTWVICGLLWQKLLPAVAAIATLFQGMVALPIALGSLFWMGAFEFRPETGEINQLSMLMAMSQLLIIPLLIAIFRKKHYTLIPFVFSGAGAVHFLLYAWLYQTVGYIVMTIFIAVVLAILYGMDKESTFISENAAAKACYATGFILVITGTFFIFI